MNCESLTDEEIITLVLSLDNETSALGAAIVPKNKLSTILFERFPILYNLFQTYF